jgi:hypothetical protein
MAEFRVIVRRQKIRCFFVVNNLCICYRKRNYMIEPDEVGWKMKVGKGLDNDLLQEIGQAIEEYLKTNK